jgi:hypothetical protein
MFATGAYGRSAKIEDWMEGLDFRVYPDGPYFSTSDVGTLFESGKRVIVFLDKRGVEVFVITLLGK